MLLGQWLANSLPGMNLFLAFEILESRASFFETGIRDRLVFVFSPIPPFSFTETIVSAPPRRLKIVSADDGSMLGEISDKSFEMFRGIRYDWPPTEESLSGVRNSGATCPLRYSNARTEIFTDPLVFAFLSTTPHPASPFYLQTIVSAPPRRLKIVWGADGVFSFD
ncbi:hypothetical protein CEXT_473601 [Caerostris extrusa]|uniref:Uncharacterized protein n=1 Tax=Caerostris extrusa TaxID=172846 RepID=A0AAV4TT19_CAEEX|nr:hypothetical protein CEXT_473601 [Caerostris extrusa]